MRIEVVRLSAVTEELEVGAGTSVDDLLHDATGSRVFSAEGAELAQSVPLVGTSVSGEEAGQTAILLVPPTGDSEVAEQMLEMVTRAMVASDPSKTAEKEAAPEPEPEPEPVPTIAAEELGGMEEAFERLDRENTALRERLAAADAERIQTAQMCVQMKAKFENIIEEIVAENASLVKAAERSVAIGYQHKPTRLGKAANVTQGPDGRLSAAGSFRSSRGMSMTGRSDTYTLAGDLPGGRFDSGLNIEKWDLPPPE